MLKIGDKVQLDDFVGKSFRLSGVGGFKNNDETAAAHFTFVLDGVAYDAMEDPQDGYRSALEDIEVIDTKHVTNRFADVEVVCNWSEQSLHLGGDQVIEFRDFITGQVVIEVGTERYNDYYPGFVGAFFPQNMCLNQPSVEVEAPPAPAVVEDRGAAWGAW